MRNFGKKLFQNYEERKREEKQRAENYRRLEGLKKEQQEQEKSMKESYEEDVVAKKLSIILRIINDSDFKEYVEKIGEVKLCNWTYFMGEGDNHSSTLWYRNRELIMKGSRTRAAKREVTAKYETFDEEFINLELLSNGEMYISVKELRIKSPSLFNNLLAYKLSEKGIRKALIKGGTFTIYDHKGKNIEYDNGYSSHDWLYFKEAFGYSFGCLSIIGAIIIIISYFVAGFNVKLFLSVLFIIAVISFLFSAFDSGLFKGK